MSACPTSIGAHPVRMITKAHILAMVNELADTRLHKWRGNDKGGSLSEASGVLRHLRSFFRWAVDMDLIAIDPTLGVRDPSVSKRERERERVLSEAEIIALWRVCESIRYPFGPIVQLLLLTGQRVREVGDMTWRELDLERRIWSLPSARAKNHRAHDIHLSDLALEIINQLPRFVGEHDFVFSVSGKKPVQSYSDAKTKIDKRLAELLGDVAPWVFHDLRRTVATFMADLGIAPHVLDRVLNHVSGTITGVARVYNRHEYRDERKAALDAWGRFIEGLVYPHRAQQNVVAMRGR